MHIILSNVHKLSATVIDDAKQSERWLNAVHPNLSNSSDNTFSQYALPLPSFAQHQFGPPIFDGNALSDFANRARCTFHNLLLNSSHTIRTVCVLSKHSTNYRKYFWSLFYA